MSRPVPNFFLILMAVALFLTSHASGAARGQEISSWLYKKLEAVEKHISEKRYAEANELLQSSLKKLKKQNFERAVVLRSLASVAAIQGHYRKASEFLGKSLATNALPKEQARRASINLGQLLIADGQYKKAVTHLEPLMSDSDQVKPADQVLLAQAYAQLKQYKRALKWVDKAVSSSSKPAESWYQLQLALNYELRQFRKCAEILGTLVRLYPDKRRYWTELSGIYQQLKAFDKALAVTELAYRKGLLKKEKEIVLLAQLYLHQESPLMAARLVEKELDSGRVKRTEKNLELLANSLIQAREFKKAEEPLLEAAELAVKGRLSVRLARIYIEQEKWEKARSALSRGLKKGGLKSPGEAWLMVGIACYELDDQPCSQKALNKAKSYKKQKKSAKQWLEYIESERAEKI